MNEAFKGCYPYLRTIKGARGVLQILQLNRMYLSHPCYAILIQWAVSSETALLHLQPSLRVFPDGGLVVELRVTFSSREIPRLDRSH
jgi:hypothetical protein